MMFFAMIAALLSMLALNTSYIPGPLSDDAILEDEITKAVDFVGTSYDSGEGFAPPGVGVMMGAVVEVTALDYVTEDETYTFTLQESADGQTWNNCGPAVAVTAVSNLTVPGIVSKRYQRLSLDVDGTTPSITYSAYLIPLR